jgi:hypothetical protein
MAVVIVEVTPPKPQAGLVEALLDACSAGSDGARCEAATDPEPAGTVAIAIVRWQDGDELSVRVEVGLRHAEDTRAAPEWRARTLTFHTADSRVERWRAAGLTIATLAFSPEEGRSSEAPSSEPAPETNSPRTEAPPPGRSSTTVASSPSSTTAAPSRPPVGDAGTAVRDGSSAWVGASALVGSGLDDVRWGFAADAGYRFALPVFVRLSIGLAWQPGASGTHGQDVSLTWTTASAGGGVALALGSVSLLPRAALRVEGLRANSSGPPEDSQSHFQLGAEIGVDALLNLGQTGVFLGVTGYRNRFASEVRVGEESVGRDEATGWLITLGFRYEFSKRPNGER